MLWHHQLTQQTPALTALSQSPSAQSQGISLVVQPGPAITLLTILTYTIIHAPPPSLQETNKEAPSTA